MWTLNEALQECARNTYNTKSMIRIAGSGYTGKGLQYATRFASGLNYAMRKISREIMGPETSETIATDENGQFALADLTLRCLRVKAVYVEEDEIVYSNTKDDKVTVDGYISQDVTVYYQYLPDELDVGADLDVEFPLDDRYVDPRVLCQYADYQFLSEEGTEYDSARSQVWLGLFNDSFSNIEDTNKRPTRVRYNG